MPILNPIPQHLLFTRNDSADKRLGEMVQKADLNSTQSESSQIAIIGYPDDQGVKANGGRPGSALAPDLIRKALYKMTPEKSYQILDFGNLAIETDLANTHLAALNTCMALHQKGHLIVSLGGGHDYGYPDGAAFLKKYISSGIKPLIVNFDAHLDVRPVVNNNFHSGTPFRRLKEEFNNQFHLLEIGLQRHCNALAHEKWAASQGILNIFNEDIERIGLLPLLRMHLNALPDNTPTFLSLDIDVLGGLAALGASQSFYSGLNLTDLRSGIREIQKRMSIKSCGVYEVNPAIDYDDQTSKTAAVLIFQMLTDKR